MLRLAPEFTAFNTVPGIFQMVQIVMGDIITLEE